MKNGKKGRIRMTDTLFLCFFAKKSNKTIEKNAYGVYSIADSEILGKFHDENCKD